MTTTQRQQLRLRAIRTTKQIERSKRIFLLVALAGILLFMATACTTQPRLPDPFDTALQSAIVQMFNTEGDPK